MSNERKRRRTAAVYIKPARSSYTKRRPRRSVLLHGDCMRILMGLCFALTLSAAQSGKSKHPDSAPRDGIKTPGVQISVVDLKAEAELPLAPRWIVFADTILIPDKSGGLERLDAKSNKLVDPVPSVAQLCGGAAAGFKSLWIPDCGCAASGMTGYGFAATRPAARISAIASRASTSARSFISWPAWPLTQCQRT